MVRTATAFSSARPPDEVTDGHGLPKPSSGNLYYIEGWVDTFGIGNGT